MTQPPAWRTRAAALLPGALSRRGYVPILLVALLGGTVTWILYQEVTRLERQRVQTLFNDAARDRILAVQREILARLDLVHDLGSLIDASQRVRRRQFREFVQPVLKRVEGVRSLEWVPRVTEDLRESFVQTARRSFPPFRLADPDGDGGTRPAPPRPEHFPRLYVQPYRADHTQLGLDLAALPAVAADLRAARAAGRLLLVPEHPWRPRAAAPGELVAYLPIFEPPPSDDLPEETPPPDHPLPSRELRGFAVGRLDLAGIVDQAISYLSPSGIDIHIHSAAGGELLYLHRSRLRARDAEPGGGTGLQLTDTLTVAGHHWILECSAIPGSFHPELLNGRLVLGGGIAFTLLFVVYLYSLIGRAEQVARTVAQRTLQLQVTNQALNRQVEERLRVEQALQSLNATLEQRVARRSYEAERRAAELEQFAYVASHDLKAPLRAISNLAEWLKEDLADCLTEETREQLDLLRDRVARMHALIEGLLTYSRVGRSAGSATAVDSAALVAETLDSLDPPPGFRIEIAPGMPRLVTDGLQLGQVFANLIGNAIKHHHRDTGHVRIAGRDLGGQYEFSVSDDGPGIAPEYHHKVFQIFQTLKAGDFGRDTGIGLALVRKLVEEHGGTVTLESAEGQGASFRFTWNPQSHSPTSGSVPGETP